MATATQTASTESQHAPEQAIPPHAAPENIVYIQFMDSIDPVKATKFIQFCGQVIDQYHPTKLYFLISSGGGEVDSGFVVYNYLKSLHEHKQIVMHNTGGVDSIANIIFMGAQTRYGTSNACFLFHGITMNFNGPQGSISIKEALSRIEIMESRIAETIVHHSDLTIAELEQLFQHGQSKDATFALEKHVIHEIRPAVLPEGSIFLVMNFY